MSPKQAHLHMLETWPKERITKHERTPREDRRGMVTLITPELVERYRKLKAEGTKYDDIRKELNVSSDTMRKLKAAR